MNHCTVYYKVVILNVRSHWRWDILSFGLIRVNTSLTVSKRVIYWDQYSSFEMGIF
jgi:hypothetical protein